MNPQMKKGIIELCIMKVIDTKKSSAFEILKKIKGLDVNENTVYPILRRLNNDGYLIQEKGNNEVGAPRKYYDLTNKGRDELIQELGEWDAFIESVSHILKEENNE